MTETRFVSGYQVDNPFRKYKVNFTIKHILFIVLFNFIHAYNSLIVVPDLSLTCLKMLHCRFQTLMAISQTEFCKVHSIFCVHKTTFRVHTKYSWQYGCEYTASSLNEERLPRYKQIYSSVDATIHSLIHSQCLKLEKQCNKNAHASSCTITSEAKINVFRSFS